MRGFIGRSEFTKLLQDVSNFFFLGLSVEKYRLDVWDGHICWARHEVGSK